MTVNYVTTNEITTLRDRLATLRSELAFSRGEVTPDDRIFQHCERQEGTCEHHGAFEQIRRWADIRGRVYDRLSRCPGCVSAEIEQAESRIREITVCDLLDYANISPRFADRTFDNFNPVNRDARRVLGIMKAYADAWPEMREKGAGLVLCGKPGTGKNHLAVALAKHVINEHQSSVLLTSVLRIIRAVKRAWSKQGEMTEDDLMSVYTSKDLLIIDEVGVQYGTNAEMVILFDIINTRYEMMRPTVLISNLAPGEIAQAIGERITDRMTENGGATLIFNWDSYRAHAGEVS
jgi:DNA replication protein DnaC